MISGEVKRAAIYGNSVIADIRILPYGTDNASVKKISMEYKIKAVTEKLQPRVKEENG